MVRHQPVSMALIVLISGSAVILRAEEPGLPAALKGVGFDQRLNERVPLDISLTDEEGADIALSELVHTKPVILALVYYQCPRLCNEVLNGLVQGLLELNFDVGKEFNVVVVSFDPREDWQLAAQKKLSYLKRYGRQGAEEGWRFLTGEQESIDRLCQSVGFRYRFDETTKQFLHASGIIILTPQGNISRYFYDVHYPSRDLRLGLIEASHNKIGSPVDQVLLYCLHYDASIGKYTASIMNLVRLLGIITMVSIGLFLWMVCRRGPPRSITERLQRRDPSLMKTEYTSTSAAGSLLNEGDTS